MNPYKSRLNREIIRHIFANVGIISGPYLGQYGLSNERYRLIQTMDFAFDGDPNSIHKSPVHAGQIVLEGSKIRSIFVNLTSSLEHDEYVFVFRNENKPIYGLKLSLSNIEDDGLFMIMVGENWEHTVASVKCRALIGFETISTHGLIWEPTNDVDDLRLAAEALILLG